MNAFSNSPDPGASRRRIIGGGLSLFPGDEITRSGYPTALDPAALAERRHLADGTEIVLRAITPGDRFALREQLFLKLGKESLRNRFFCIKADLSEIELTRFCRVDFCRNVAIVAETIFPEGGRLVGVARLIRYDAAESAAEIAITVQDHYQGRGVGRLLLRKLIACARLLRIERLEAVLFAQNRRMANLLRGMHLPAESRVENEILNLSLHLRASRVPLAHGTQGNILPLKPSAKERS